MQRATEQAMKPTHNHYSRNRGGRRLVWPLIGLWLLSTLAQAANCCCGVLASADPHLQGAPPISSHGDAHSHSHHADHADSAGAVGVGHGPGQDTDSDCTELEQPDASVQWKGVVYGAAEQPEPLRFDVGFTLSRVPAAAAPLQPSGVPPPPLNPFLSTIRLLL